MDLEGLSSVHVHTHSFQFQNEGKINLVFISSSLL